VSQGGQLVIAKLSAEIARLLGRTWTSLVLCVKTGPELTVRALCLHLAWSYCMASPRLRHPASAIRRPTRQTRFGVPL
jgi:hypothetical protein